MHAVKPVQSASGSWTGRSLLTVAISSRALFQLESEDQLFRGEGQQAFDEFMVSNLEVPLRPGVAFPVVRRLLGLNTTGTRDMVTVIILSRNSPAAGTRVMKSINTHGLDIQRGVFTSGEDRFKYAVAMGADLFLSAHEQEVWAAGRAGVPAALMTPRDAKDNDDESLRIAFDGDSVLFSGASDAVFRSGGIGAFRDHEARLAQVPLEAGPFKSVIERLVAIRRALGAGSRKLRLGLVTARGTETHERALSTLMSWGVHIDDAIFADGMEKGPLLQALGAHFFVDDSETQVESASRHLVSAGRVPANTESVCRA
jgi:5'-nucleotidase